MLRVKRMWRTLCVGLCLIAGALAVPAHAQPTPPLEAFTAAPDITELEVAPGGRHFVVRMDGPNGQVLRIFSIDDEGVASVTHTISAGETRAILWARWAASDRLVFSRMTAPPTAGPDAENALEQPSTRLYAIDADGSDRLALIPVDELTGFEVRDQDDIVDLLPDDPRHILVAYSAMTPLQPDVMRVDIRTGETMRVQRGRAGVRRWLADADHEVRLGIGATSSGRLRLEIRDRLSGRWQALTNLIYGAEVRFDPVGFSEDPDRLYVISNHEEGPAGLYLFDAAQDDFVQRIYRHSELDVVDARLTLGGGRVLSVTLNGEGEERRIDVRRSQEEARWERLYRGKAVRVVSASLDSRFVTVFVSGPDDPGSYYIYDRADGGSRYVGTRWSSLRGYRMAPVFDIELTARDGATLEAQIVTGSWRGALDRSQPLPFIIVPYAGPHAADRAAFDHLAQFLASRNFGVVRLITRADASSAIDGGERSLGQAVAEDVLDAAAWLVDNGYVDSWRLAVLGEAFGGYAGLQALASQTDVFACAAAINGVSDLGALTAPGRNATLTATARHARALASPVGAPVTNAVRLSRPVLLAHERAGSVIPFSQSRALAQAMRAASGDVRLVELAPSGGRFEGDRDRTALYGALAEFFEGCLRPGGTLAAPAVIAPDGFEALPPILEGSPGEE